MSTKDLKTFEYIYDQTETTRLDKFLVEQLRDSGFSRVAISNWIIEGKVLVNGTITNSKNHTLKQGDKVSVDNNHSPEQVTDLKATEMEIPIVYEDDDIIVINKPNNLVVHPGAGNTDNTLVNGLLFQMKELSSINSELRPGIVHRLDKQTTGLLIVAKNNKAHFRLSEELKNHEIKRVYMALVHGTIKERSGTIDAPIARDANHRLRMSISDVNAKQAVTHFRVIETFANYTLIECELETGRTHQIRVHLQWIGHPVVNDPLYSKYPVENKTIGQYLHARKIVFKHPTNGKLMDFECDLPDFFKQKLDSLRKEKDK